MIEWQEWFLNSSNILTRIENHKVNEKNKIKSERWKLLIRLGEFLEGPMIFLGFLWLILIIVELTIGLNDLLERISILIWIIFIIDFIISFIIAPVKKYFLKKTPLLLYP